MPRSPRRVRIGNLPAAARVMGAQDPGGGDPVAQKRRLVANLCKMLDPTRAPLGDENGGGNGNGHAPRPPDSSAPPNGSGNGHVQPLPVEGLSPRMIQTLQRLLAGDSEKQIALRLDRSRHTVHVYVKQLYKRFGVCSRGELLARFVDGSAPRGRLPPPPASPE